MIVHGATIFAGAFLLFVVQPLMARRLLPWFGGSPTVWIVSLLFFQSALLLGYLYAHVSSRHLDGRRQAFLHIGLVAVALVFLPIGAEAPDDPASGDPTLKILALLAVSLGGPLLTLCATNPLLQRWLSNDAGPRIYRLFAVSNLGSLLGLWSYPFLFEPRTTVAFQLRAWSYAYVLFAVLTVMAALRAARAAIAPAAPSRVSDVHVRLLWLALSATGAVLLMATSNQLTRNVAAVPFLWVLPLSLYLLSFIVSFEHDRWYVRWLWVPLFLGTLLAVLHLLGQETEPALVTQLTLYSLNLLAGCMICHGELARRRPHEEGLTSFYLYVAAGGVLGGAAVSLVAPELFRGYWEYPVGLAFVYLFGGLAMAFSGKERFYWVGGGVALVIFLGSYVRSESAGVVTMRRSFFGVLRVYDHNRNTRNWQRYLWNGPVAHGGQIMNSGRHGTPILYYGPETGVALAMQHAVGARRIGVVGLGTGSLAAFAWPGDELTFYEINSDVIDVAREYFYYLEEAPAEIEIVEGDARLALARELRESGSREFDVLVIDAFTGDAIPVHLLTKEAFEIYQSHLVPDGILAVHVSNLHFDLKPVIRAQAEEMGSVAVLVETDADPERSLYVSDWMLITTNGAFLSDPKLQSLWTPRRADEVENLDDFLWTDDYSNLFGALRR